MLAGILCFLSVTQTCAEKNSNFQKKGSSSRNVFFDVTKLDMCHLMVVTKNKGIGNMSQGTKI